MILRSKEPYWLLKNGLMNTHPSLHDEIACEVLIIGGGITGALLAYKLSGKYNTVVIDKRDIAMGSTSATTALLQYEIDEPLHTLIEKVGEPTAVQSYREGINAISSLDKIINDIGLDCDFNRKGSIFFADSKKNLAWLKAEYECRNKYSLGVAWLTSNELKHQYGIESSGAIVSSSAASVDAYRLAHQLLHHCSYNNNLRVFDHTEALTIKYGKTKNKIITQLGTITASKIIFTSGYETIQRLNKKMVNLNSTYALVSEPISSLPSTFIENIFWNTANPYLYFRTTSDKRILVGGGDELFKNAIRRDRKIDNKEKFLLESFNKYVPDLSIVPDFCWAGTFGVTPDALPYIGSHPKFPNSYFVLGFGGNGITFSIMGMEIISDALAGKHNDMQNYFSLTR